MAEPQYTPPTKVCPKCHTEQPLDAFSADRRTPSGRRYICRACEGVAWRLRMTNPERLARTRAYDRIRNQAPERRFDRTRNATPEDPARQRARAALKWAVRSGKITRPATCQECGGGGRIDGHHPDYSRPYDVEWLCTRCHGIRHRKPL